ncbi:MAG: PepSY domain-containing protein [Cystobacter sp.]
MKLTPRTFRIQWDSHAWSGVLASLFLFVIFFCGVFSLFREDIEVWQEPAFHTSPPGETPPSFDALLASLEKELPLPRGTNLGLLTHEETRLVTAYVFTPEGSKVFWVDPARGTVLPEHSRLSGELFWMHFFYRVPWGMELSGLAAIALLVALVSGLVIHLKDLRTQWWRFRPDAKSRFSASDAHKVLGVFGLPFTAMMGWTGAVLCLVALVGQGLTAGVYKGDPARVTALRGHAQPVRVEAHRDAPMLPLDALVARARGAVPGAQGVPRYVELHLRGDASAWVGVFFQLSPLGADHFAFVDAVKGDALATSVDYRTPSFTFERVLFDLHYAHFGGLLLKVLYALLALAGCAVLLTGNLIWLERRDEPRARRGNRLLERLTVGVSAGLVLAVAVYFAANRVLPEGLARRADWEFGVFLGAWALVTGLSLLPRLTPRRLGAGWSALAAALYAGVVVADAVLQPANLFTALARGMPSVFLTEVLLMALAAGCAALAWGLRAPRGPPGRAA